MDGTLGFDNSDDIGGHLGQWSLVWLLLAIYCELRLNIRATIRYKGCSTVHDGRNDFCDVLSLHLDCARRSKSLLIANFPLSPCGGDRSLDLLQLVLGTQIPISAPDTMNNPAVAFEDLLTQPVTISR